MTAIIDGQVVYYGGSEQNRIQIKMYLSIAATVSKERFMSIL
jgi:hypothetical protein